MLLCRASLSGRFGEIVNADVRFCLLLYSIAGGFAVWIGFCGPFVYFPMSESTTGSIGRRRHLISSVIESSSVKSKYTIRGPSYLTIC